MNIKNKQRTYGFRFSIVDGCAIALCIFATFYLYSYLLKIYRQQNLQQLANLIEAVLLCPIILGHFFLFCNIFRIHRRLELIWAALFLINTSLWYTFSLLSWWKILIVQSPITIFLIAREMKNPRYHGIYSEKINPHLADYLDNKIINLFQNH